MRKCFTLLLLFAALFAHGQNLVKNGDFELYNNCSCGPSNISNALYVSQANTTGSSDYFNPCVADTCYVPVPNNFAGGQTGIAGDAYGGFYAYYYSLDQTVYREYVQLELTQPLDIGKQYTVSFYVSLAGFSGWACNGIGAAFVVGEYSEPGWNVINVQPEYYKDNVILDTTVWTLISFDFSASAAYDHIILGEYLSNQTIAAQQVPYTILPDPFQEQLYKYAYYYIDDIVVFESINIPNVFTPTPPDGTNDTFVIENLPDNSQLTIYNRWGTKVYESVNYNNDWDGEGHSQGVYYYILTTPNGKSYHGTVTVL